MQTQQQTQNIYAPEQPAFEQILKDCLLKMAKERKTLITEPVYLIRKSRSKYATLVLPDGTKQRKYLPRATRCNGRNRNGRRCAKRSFTDYCAMHEDEHLLPPYVPQSRLSDRLPVPLPPHPRLPETLLPRSPYCPRTVRFEEKQDRKDREDREDRKDQMDSFPTHLPEDYCSRVAPDAEMDAASEVDFEEEKQPALPPNPAQVDEQALAAYLHEVFRGFVLQQEIQKQSGNHQVSSPMPGRRFVVHE